MFVSDSETLTPAHLLNGCRITFFPHQAVEHFQFTAQNYGEAALVQRRAKLQVAACYGV